MSDSGLDKLITHDDGTLNYLSYSFRQNWPRSRIRDPWSTGVRLGLKKSRYEGLQHNTRNPKIIAACMVGAAREGGRDRKSREDMRSTLKGNGSSQKEHNWPRSCPFKCS